VGADASDARWSNPRKRES